MLKSGCEVFGDPAYPRRHKTALGPYKTYIPGLVYEFRQYGLHVRVKQFFCQGNLCKHTNADTRQHGSSNGLDTVRR